MLEKKRLLAVALLVSSVLLLGSSNIEANSIEISDNEQQVKAAPSKEIVISINGNSHLAGINKVNRKLIGFNLPPHQSAEAIKAYGITGKKTNGNWELLHALNPGYIRQWINASECGIDSMKLPQFNPDKDGDYDAWLQMHLAQDSTIWNIFDRYMGLVSELGTHTEIMLCIPTFPIWLGPFRWQDEPYGKIIDTRTGQIVSYDTFIEWAGISEKYIGDSVRFKRFCRRVTIYVRLLTEHCLANPLLREHIRYFEIGNETDGAGDARSIVWRMWVHGKERAKQLELGRKLRPIDQGLLQGIYLAAYKGVRAGDPDSLIKIGGPATSWAHNQKSSKGAFYYLKYFIKGTVDGAKGIGQDKIDFLSYHQYGLKYSHEATINELFKAFGKPLFLTEYNASAGGHGMNFMATGASTVANVLIQLSRTPHAAGAAFFKGSGGGFGMLLKRAALEPDKTGAYWTMRLFSQLIVGGVPLEYKMVGNEKNDVDCLAVRFNDQQERYAAIIVNKSARPRNIKIYLSKADEMSMKANFIELPIAKKRNDYRNIKWKEIRQENIDFPMDDALLLNKRGVLIVSWGYTN